MTEVRSLPLFPLQTVLFPKGTLPLQIFEERYRLMLEHCLEDDAQFGVVLIKSGSEVGGPAIPYSVGTVAQIIQVNPAKEGRMFISVYGRERFKIRDITQVEPYMKAEVELLSGPEEPNLPGDRIEEIREAVTQHVRLTLGLRGSWNKSVPLPDEPDDLSYYVAALIQMPSNYKQSLLEELSTARRLERESEWLEAAREPLKARVARQLLYQRFGRH